jgi:hypothetical protein
VTTEGINFTILEGLIGSSNILVFGGLIWR